MPFHSNVRVRCSQGALQEAFAGNVAVAITYYNAARASAQSKDFVFGDFRGKKTECPAYLVSVCVCTAAAKTCHCYRRQTLRAPTVYRSRTVSVDHPFVLHSTSLSRHVLSPPLKYCERIYFLLPICLLSNVPCTLHLACPLLVVSIIHARSLCPPCRVLGCSLSKMGERKMSI